MVTSVAAPTTADTFTALNTTGAAPVTANDSASADRFLKLLVTQLQNQDPLNPMDNAQITTQMAQINTVSGIDKLNTTVQGLNTQFVQMQALQGAALVGHDVTVTGNHLAVENGFGLGGYDLAGTADAVKLEVLTPAGNVVETVNLGTQPAGRHSFEWPSKGLPDGTNLNFRITATSGTQAVSSSGLMRDQVQSVTTTATGLVLQTRYSGDVAYSDVKAFN
jgi:flagellar basal-body rod modification protein FlgD